MIVIKEIKTIIVPEKSTMIHHYDGILIGNGADVASKVSVTREMVEGQRFVNANNETVIIGWAKDVQEKLGLPFEVFDDLKFRNAELGKIKSELSLKIFDLQEALRYYKNMTFWQRLKFLFNGV